MKFSEINNIKLICKDEETDEEIQVKSNLESSTREANLESLGPGKYNIYLEIHVDESEKIFKSRILRLIQDLKPNPPTLSLSIPELNSRRTLQNLTHQLINERDKLMTLIVDSKKIYVKNA